MTPDWDDDPEYRRLHDDFTASLAERLTKLRRAVASGTLGPELQSVAHKLGGVASLYGYDSLGRVAIALDDFMAIEPGLPSGERERMAFTLARLLDQAIDQAASRREDPTAFLGRAEVAETISVVEALVAAAMRGSS